MPKPTSPSHTALDALPRLPEGAFDHHSQGVLACKVSLSLSEDFWALTEIVQLCRSCRLNVVSGLGSMSGSLEVYTV